VNLSTERLAKALLADRNRPVTARTDIGECFVCERGMVYRGTRFCSARCRDWYDAGNPAHQEITYRWRDGRPMKMGTRGFLINCAHCSQEFDSKGLRCCSRDCEQSYRERQDNLAVMAEVGIELTAKRECHTCGARIPKWRKGRRVSSKTRFCSPKCSQKTRRAPDTHTHTGK